MLVLSRKHDEAIQIGAEITIRVVKIVGRTVKLGIVAPPHVRVMRAELVVEAPPTADDELLAEAELFGTADGIVADSFLDLELELPGNAAELPVNEESVNEEPQSHEEPSEAHASAPVRSRAKSRLDRRFPMPPVGTPRLRVVSAATAN